MTYQCYSSLMCFFALHTERGEAGRQVPPQNYILARWLLWPCETKQVNWWRQVSNFGCSPGDPLGSHLIWDQSLQWLRCFLALSLAIYANTVVHLSRSTAAFSRSSSSSTRLLRSFTVRTSLDQIMLFTASSLPFLFTSIIANFIRFVLFLAT